LAGGVLGDGAQVAHIMEWRSIWTCDCLLEFICVVTFPSIRDSMDLFIAVYVQSNPKYLSVSTWDLLAAWCYTNPMILAFILQARAMAFTKCVVSNYFSWTTYYLVIPVDGIWVLHVVFSKIYK
jgi:hypothetical protein